MKDYKEIYKTTYAQMTITEYSKMTKKELFEVADFFWEALDDNNCHRFIAPWGDDWLGKYEAGRSIRYQFIEHKKLKKVPCMSKIKGKKELLIAYVIALDIAVNNMHEVFHEHPYHYWLGHESKHYGEYGIAQVCDRPIVKGR